MKKHTERPLIVWLQGGVTDSSTGNGNFEEIGPLDVSLKPRNSSWDKHANILFVDSPVGAGFSHADNKTAYATSYEQVVADFVQALKGFYKAVPDMQSVPLYIFGEDTGGKVVPLIALALNKVSTTM